MKSRKLGVEERQQFINLQNGHLPTLPQVTNLTPADPREVFSIFTILWLAMLISLQNLIIFQIESVADRRVAYKKSCRDFPLLSGFLMIPVKIMMPAFNMNYTYIETRGKPKRN